MEFAEFASVKCVERTRLLRRMERNTEEWVFNSC